MKTKILILCFPGDYSGVPIYCKTIVKKLNKVANFSVLTSYNDGVFNGIPSKLIIKPVFKNSLNPLSVLINLKHLIKIIRQENPDIVHLNGSMFGMIGRVASIFMSQRFVFTYHGLPWGNGRSFFYGCLMLFIETVLLNVTNISTIVISKMDAERLQKINFLKKKLKYIPNAVELDLVKMSTGTGQKRFEVNSTKTILCVARFSPQKNHRRLFEAFNLLLGSYELTIVGVNTDSDECKSLARSICSNEKFALINFEGESTDVFSYLKDATIFCLSSNYEGMPLSAIEAMAAGTPVVMPEVGGAAEFESCGGAMIYRPNTSNELSKVIEKLCADSDLLFNMSKAGVLGYKTLFSEDKFSEGMVSMYEINK